MGSKTIIQKITNAFLIVILITSNFLFSQKASVIVQSGHFKDIKCAEFSPDAKFAATGGQDKTVIVYDVVAGMQMTSFNVFAGQLKQVAFSKDSKKVMGLSNPSNNMPVIFACFDITKNDTLYTIRYDQNDKHSFERFQVSYDEKLIALRDNDEIYIYNFANGKFLYKVDLDIYGGLPDNEHWHFTHDNKKIILENEKEGTINVIDLLTKKIVKTFPADVKHIGMDMAEFSSISQDDKYYHRSRGIEKWYKYDLSNGSLVSETTPESNERGGNTDGHITENGKTIMLNDLGELNFYESETGKKIKKFDLSKTGAKVSAISKDGKKIILCAYNFGHDMFGKYTVSDLVFVDGISGKILKTFSGTPLRPTRVVFSNNSKNILIANNGSHRLWNLQTADGVKSLHPDTRFNEKQLNHLMFSPDDQVIFSSGERPTLLNIPTNEIKSYKSHFYHNYDQHRRQKSGGGIYPDKEFKKLVDNGIVHDMATGEYLCNIQDEYAGYQHGRELTPDAKYFVAYSHKESDHTGVKVWVHSASDCKKVAEYIVPMQASNEYIDFDDTHHSISNDGKFIAFINEDYTLVELLTGKIILKKKIDRSTEKGFWLHSDPNNITFSPDDKQIAIANSNKEVGIIETATGKVIQTLKGHNDEVNCAEYSPDGKLIVTSGEDGRVILWNREKGSQLATFIGLDSSDYIVITPDNYYMSTKKGLKGVGFRMGNKMFAVEQFDMRQNRPDTVLHRIGEASKIVLKMYKMAWLKRIKKAGFSPEMLSPDFHVPDISIENRNDLPMTSSEEKIKIQIKMSDSLYTLDRYNVYVNDIPVYGSRGFSLRNKNVKTFSTEVSLPLSSGENKIMVSVFNSKGTESTRESFDILCDKSFGKPDLYVLAIGVSQYAEKGHDLKFAVKDAGDLTKALSEGNTKFGNIKTKTILNNDATLASIKALKSFFAESKPDDQVVLYFSGHGLLDEKLDYYLALHDVQFENPSKGGLPYDVLESLVDSIPARNRLVFIDACHSGEVDKEDLVADIRPGTQVVANARSGSIGVKPKAGLKNSLDYMNMLFSDVQKGTGASVISAAGGMEFALESKDWNNGVFTYSIINGLKNGAADYDEDKNVTLSELKKYISKRVYELTNGKQNPTMRKENAATDFVIFGN